MLYCSVGQNVTEYIKHNKETVNKYTVKLNDKSSINVSEQLSCNDAHQIYAIQ